MAAVTPTIKRYPVCEANVLKSRITGRIYSQYELDPTDFATEKAYNGMILAINDKGKTVKLPNATPASRANEVYALHMSVEAEYEPKGLNSFAVARSNDSEEANISVQFPRMYALSVGDVLHTNCVKLDGTHITALEGEAATTLKTLVGTSAVYGGVDASGYIMLDTTAPQYGPKFEVVEYSTLPNGEWAVKLVVRSA